MRIADHGLMLLCAAVLLVCGGCAHYPDNPRLASISANAGYRYSVVRPLPDGDKPFVVLAFSGGGTRAAAFSFGLMEELKNVEYTAKGAKRKLIDDVEIISSVSGGSFTSTYYALNPESFFRDFPEKFLYRDIQMGLVWRLFNPYNWWRLASPDFSRIDMADEYYSNTVFDNKTFSDLIAMPKGKSPFLVLNATDISITHRFEFTQDQFDLLCSDLSGVSLSRAVAASSNFPVAFAPLTLDIYKQPCGQLPMWIKLGMDREHNPDKRRIADATAAHSYREADRNYVHLLDGGLSDNLGLRGPFQAVSTTDSPWSILKLANLDKLGRLMMIAVNAKTTKQRSWDQKSSPPGIGAVLDVALNGPMDDVSFDSTEMVDGHFTQMEQLSRTVASCNKRLGQYCPAAPQVYNPISTDFTFSELTFDNIPDPRLRRCLQELPTSFALPRNTVDLLRVAAGYLLMNSSDFVAGMKRLDPVWQPRQVVIDPKLIDEVCGRIPE